MDEKRVMQERWVNPTKGRAVITLAANPGSATERTRHYRRSLFSILVFGLFLSACVTSRTKAIEPPAAAEFTFEQYEVVTGSAKRQAVLPGFLLGGAIAELAVVNMDENGDRCLRIYAFGDGSWAPMLDATLRPEVLFVGTANIGGRDRVITYEPGRLNWFDPESVTEHPLVAVTSNFNPPRRGEIPHVDVTRDVNGDGRDDLVVPQVDGFWVSIQMSAGMFADPVKIGTSTNTAMIAGPDGEYRYTPWDHGRIHETDYNRDGRSDLVFWNEDHFEAHLQDRRGLFDPVAETFTTDVAFDSDDLNSLTAPYKARRPSAKHDPGGKMTERVLHTLADLNGDGIADLGILSLEGGSLWKMHSNYEVHFGTLTPDASTMFAPKVSTVAPSDGIPLRILSGRRDRPGIQQQTLGHDGQNVTMFTTMSVGGFSIVSRVLGALVSRSVSLDIEFFRMEGGIYPDKPSAARKTRIYALGRSGERFLPAVLIGDVNGDRYSDLLVGRGRNELRVFLGVPGPELFTRRHQKVAVAMPSDEYTWLVDLNKDGKQDILMHHPSTTEPHRVTMLIAR